MDVKDGGTPVIPEPGEGTPPEGTQTAAGEGAKYTQADIDRVAAEVRAKTSRKAERDAKILADSAKSEILNKLGIEDLDGYLEKREQELSVEDKYVSLQAKYQRVQSQYEKASKELDDNRSRQKSSAIEKAVFDCAKKAGCQDIELLQDHLTSKGKLACSSEGIVYAVESDGSMSEDSLEELITKTLEAKPYLKAAVAAAGSGSRPSASESASTSKDSIDSRYGSLKDFLSE